MVGWGTEPGDIENPQRVASSEGEELYVAKKLLEKSELLKGLMQDVQDDTGPIPLNNVAMNVLKKVLEWAEHHKDDPVEEKENDARDKKSTDIDEWDQKFMQVDQEMLFEIILAANYLDIKPLLDTGCKTVANMIKGKSPEEIRKTFNITNDFTYSQSNGSTNGSPEEEAQIKKENEWAEDR